MSPDAPQSESMRDFASSDHTSAADRDPPCITVRRDDSSRNVPAPRAGCPCSSRAAESLSNGLSPTSTSPDDALRLAIKVALDAGDYDRTSTLLEILRLSPSRRA